MQNVVFLPALNNFIGHCGVMRATLRLCVLCRARTSAHKHTLAFPPYRIPLKKINF